MSQPYTLTNYASPGIMAKYFQEVEGDTCQWLQDRERSDIWHTACGRHYCFGVGCHIENDVKFCWECGKKAALVVDNGKVMTGIEFQASESHLKGEDK